MMTLKKTMKINDDVEENNEDCGQMLEHKTSLDYEYGWKLRSKPLAKTTIKVCKCSMVRPVSKRRHPAAAVDGRG